MDGLPLSDGYLWPDRAVMRRLEKEGYIRMEDGIMSPTDKGRSLVAPYLSLKENDHLDTTLKLRPEILDRWVQKLRQAFPPFRTFDPACSDFDETERTYKLATRRLLDESLGHSNPTERISGLVKALSDGNLLNWRVTAPLTPNGNADRSSTDPALLTMAAAAAGPPEAHAAALAEFVEQWSQGVPGNQRDSARQIGEILLMDLAPDTGIFIRATVRDDLWREGTGEKFPAPRDIAETYRLEHAFMSAVRQAFAERGLAPRDYIDVQSALWVVHNYKVEDDMNEEPPSQARVEARSQPARNLVLYGPPGTGKTYQTAAEALRLCRVDVPEDREDVMAAYARLRAERRIEFVTFHQSMSYEEFVEGRQPTTDGLEDGSGPGFRLETVHGIFRRIARRADERERVGHPDRKVLSLEGRQFFKMSVGNSRLAEDAALFDDAILDGCTLFGFYDIDWSDPAFGDKSRILQAAAELSDNEAIKSTVHMTHLFRNEMKVGDIIIVTKGNFLVRAIGEITGDYEYHPRPEGDYPHRRNVRWLWHDPRGVSADEFYRKNFSQRTIYPLRRDDLNMAVLETYLGANSDRDTDEPQDFVLIIDEINRANISKVFGELITLIEPDKRLGTENALTVRLPYSGDEFGVPANLHILGTMNTADRSIALLDTALRRRFEFREMLPQPDTLQDVARRCGLDLPRVLTVLNERIEYLYDREHQIGHAYFINCASRDDVDAVMRHKVIPLLAEYFFEDWGKVAAVLGDASSSDEQAVRGGFMIRDVLNVPPGMEDGDGAPRYRWSLRRDAFDYAGLGGE